MYLNSKKLKGHYFANFVYRGEFLERNPRNKQGTTVQSVMQSDYCSFFVTPM